MSKRKKRLLKARSNDVLFFNHNIENDIFAEIQDGDDCGLLSAINSGCLVMISEEDLDKIKKGRF